MRSTELKGFVFFTLNDVRLLFVFFTLNDVRLLRRGPGGSRPGGFPPELSLACGHPSPVVAKVRDVHTKGCRGAALTLNAVHSAAPKGARGGQALAHRAGVGRPMHLF